MNIKTLFWDLGGVNVTNNIQGTFLAYGLEYADQQKEAWKAHRLGKISANEFFAKALKGTRLENNIEDVAETARTYIKVKQNGALPLVMRLNRSGKYQQGVISNHSREWGRYMRETFGLEQHFEPKLIIISAEVGMDKTGTEIFKFALQKAKSKPDETLFWDDTQYCVDSAKKAGLHAELFKDRDQAAEILQSKYGINVYNGGK